MLNQVVLIGVATKKTEKEVFIKVDSLKEDQRIQIEVPVVLTKDMLDTVQLGNMVGIRGYLILEDQIKVVGQKFAMLSSNIG